MNKQKLNQLNKELSVIKAKALLKVHGFYASILVSLKYRFTEESGVTAYTDGVSVTIGVKFWGEQDIKKRLFLLLHEMMHIILKHTQRFKDLSIKNKDFSIYGAAADYFINLMLMDDNQGYYEFIPEGLLDDKYRGMSTEEIYQDLLKNQKNNPPSNSGGIGSDLKPSKLTGNSIQQKEVDNIVKSSLESNKAKGAFSSNSSFTNEMDLLLKVPKINWKSALARYMNVKFKDTKNYMRPHRRTQFNKKLFIKTAKTNVKLGDMLVYIDVSGSCSEEDVTNMATELGHIMSRYKPDSIIFNTFNTEIHQRFQIRSVKDIPTHLMISGGTEVQVCITDINNHNRKVCVAVIMSDFWSPEFSKPEKTPLIMLSVNNPDFKSEHGVVIEYN